MTTTFKLFFLLFIFSSCDKTYKLYSDRISSSDAIKDSFHLSEIAVASFENDGRPSKYSSGLTIFCGPNAMLSGFSADSVHNDTEKKLRADAWKTMDSIMKINGNTIGGQGHETSYGLSLSGILISKNYIHHSGHTHKLLAIRTSEYMFSGRIAILPYQRNEAVEYKFPYCLKLVCVP